MSIYEQLEHAEADLAWYLQHEPFNEKLERELRKKCTDLRNKLNKAYDMPIGV